MRIVVIRRSFIAHDIKQAIVMATRPDLSMFTSLIDIVSIGAEAPRIASRGFRLCPVQLRSLRHRSMPMRLGYEIDKRHCGGHGEPRVARLQATKLTVSPMPGSVQPAKFRQVVG